MKPGFTATSKIMRDVKFILPEQLIQSSKLIVRQYQYQPDIPVVFPKNLQGMHENRTMIQQQELFGHACIHAGSGTTCHDQRNFIHPDS